MPSRIEQLFSAASDGDVKLIRHLHDNGLKMCTNNADGFTALHVAAGSGQPKAVAALIEYCHVPVDILDAFDQKRPLHFAASMGESECAALLIAAGANVDARDRNDSGENDWSALHFAIENDHASTVAALLDGGADIHVQTHSGFDALMWAAITPSPRCLELLIDQEGVDINQMLVRDGDFNNVAVGMLHLAAQERSIECARMLLARGANASLEANHRCTPLHVAAQLGCCDICELLLEHGADIHQRNSCGCTPAFLSAGSGSLETVKLLLEHGGDINDKANNGQGLLQQLARCSDDADVCQFLIHHQKDQLLDVDGGGRSDPTLMTPLMFAARSSRSNVARVLLEHGAVVNLRGTVYAGRDDVEDDPIKCQRGQGFPGFSPLLLCGESLELHALLIKHGAEINVYAARDSSDEQQYAPLLAMHVAAAHCGPATDETSSEEGDDELPDIMQFALETAVGASLRSMLM